MKTRRISLIVIGMLVAVMSMAQQELSDKYPDTLTIETPSGSKLIFSYDRINEKTPEFNNDLWKSILNVMENATNRTELEGGLRVTYRKSKLENGDEARITVEPLDPPGDVIIIRPDETFDYTSDRIEYRILLERQAISFRLNDPAMLSEFRELNIESVDEQIQLKYENQGKVNQYVGTGSVKFGNIVIDQIDARRRTLDNLSITFIGFGLGYYRDRFVPDMGSKLALIMHDRLGNEWMEFGFLYTQQYFFERNANDNYSVDLNGWVTGFWKIKTQSNFEAGLGIGGLVLRQGDFYQGSTWKFAAYTSQESSSFSFSPEIIFTNDFKQIFPAIRVGLSF